MTLDHLIVVTEGVAGCIARLNRGENVLVEVNTATARELEDGNRRSAKSLEFKNAEWDHHPQIEEPE